MANHTCILKNKTKNFINGSMKAMTMKCISIGKSGEMS